MDFDILNKKNEFLHMIATIIPVESANRQVEAISVIVRDITEEKRLIWENVIQRNQLEQAQEIASVASWEYDFEDGLIVFSPSTYQLTGLEPMDKLRSNFVLPLDHIYETLNFWEELVLEEDEEIFSRKNSYLAIETKDIFVLFIYNYSDFEEVTRIADGIVKDISKPLNIDGYELFVTASIGIGLYPEHGSDRSTLIENTYVALQHAKNFGQSNFQVYFSKQNNTSHKWFMLEKDLMDHQTGVYKAHEK